MYITAFPCNQFDLQEPGNNSEILNGIRYVRPGKGFRPSSNLHIYGKLEVNGRNAHPMYKFLKNACPPTGDALGELKYYYWDQVRTSDIVWNFEKFIVDRQGRPMYRFHPGAWDNGKFVEKYLKQVITTNFDEDGDFQSLPVIQPPFFVIQSENTSRLNVTINDTAGSPPHRPSKGHPEPEPATLFPPIPEPMPEPERGRPRG